MVIPDITNPFFAALFRGVEDAASPRGFNVLLCNTDGLPDRQRSHLQSLQARRVDGVIVASSFLKDPSVRELRRQKGPYVLVNRFSDEGEDPFVGSDDLLGGQLATEHLIELGHTRIGHLAGKPTVSTGRPAPARLTSPPTRSPVSAPIPELIVEAGYTEESGALGARRLLSLPEPADRRVRGHGHGRARARRGRPTSWGSASRRTSRSSATTTFRSRAGSARGSRRCTCRSTSSARSRCACSSSSSRANRCGPPCALHAGPDRARIDGRRRVQPRAASSRSERRVAECARIDIREIWTAMLDNRLRNSKMCPYRLWESRR